MEVTTKRLFHENKTDFSESIQCVPMTSHKNCVISLPFNLHHPLIHLPPSGLCCPVSHLPARQDVAGQLDLGEVPLADGLEQAVVADVRLLIRAGGDGVPAPGAQRAAGLTGGLVCPAGPQRHML